MLVQKYPPLVPLLVAGGDVLDGFFGTVEKNN